MNQLFGLQHRGDRFLGMMTAMTQVPLTRDYPDDATPMTQMTEMSPHSENLPRTVRTPIRYA